MEASGCSDEVFLLHETNLSTSYANNVAMHKVNTFQAEMFQSLTWNEQLQTVLSFF
jgi:hypothetical protein